jgi:hypothetical protein
VLGATLHSVCSYRGEGAGRFALGHKSTSADWLDHTQALTSKPLAVPSGVHGPKVPPQLQGTKTPDPIAPMLFCNRPP